MKQRQTLLLGMALVVVTFAIYWPAIRYGYVVMDDDQYVYENPWLTQGLCLTSLKWAFTTTYAANWHPVTWISHLLDYSIYGLFAGGHHLTNIILHATNSLLVFLWLRGLTKRIWLSWLVAALFAWHPLHVESVAWVSERKDVLSTFFFLLTLMAYGRYAELRARAPGLEIGKSNISFASRELFASSLSMYFLALTFFVLGLMSKPMLVTVPFVLLLLDYWPLRRIELSNLKDQGSVIRNLILEKCPFFALAAAAIVITILAQQGGGAIRSTQEVSLDFRIINAFAAHAGYLGKTFCPIGLCAFYPLKVTPPLVTGILSAFALGVMTWVTFRWRSVCPWAATGWLWFLGTLIPVIGLIQVGMQSMADRYTYIPSIGLFVLVVWATDYSFSRFRISLGPAALVTCSLLVMCVGITRHQLTYWHDSEALYTRALAVTQENAVAENNLGVALAQRGKDNEAIKHYREAVRINPDYAQAHYNLGIQLANSGQPGQAAFHFSEALKQNPKSEVLHNNLGVMLARQQKQALAIEQFQQAIFLNPRYPKPYLNYGKVLQTLGQAGPAATNYAKALDLEPESPDALDRLARLFATCPDPQWRRPDGAIKLAKRATELAQNAVPGYLDTLACAYASAGQFSNAMTAAGTARELAIKDNMGSLVEQLDRDLQSYGVGQCPQADWRTVP